MAKRGLPPLIGAPWEREEEPKDRPLSRAALDKIYDRMVAVERDITETARLLKSSLAPLDYRAFEREFLSPALDNWVRGIAEVARLLEIAPAGS